ncbi:MAG: response regulator [Deltaproteobacteria bacterium]|nr:response regulator [Deltaproteobacteria bacterium]
MPDAPEHRINILLVDDDPVVRQVIERGLLNDPRLQAMGVRTTRAGDGKRAIAQAKKEPPEVAIIDLFMPRMDGFELCRTIRASEDLSDTFLIVVSGVFPEDAQVQALCAEVGARFLAKPFLPEALADLIIEVLDSGPTVPAKPSSWPIATAPPARNQATIQRSTPVERGPSSVQTGTAPGIGRSEAPLVRHNTAIGIPQPEESGELPSADTPFKRTAIPPAPVLFRHTGIIADCPVGHVMMELLDAAKTGTLIIQRGQMRKEIFVHDGRAVGAGSNLRQEALGSLLVSRGVLDEEQLTLLLGEMKKTGDKMGAVLVQMGWLTPDDVLRFLTAQARKRIVDCLRFPDGTYEFQENPEFLEREIEHDLDMPRLLFAGLQKSAIPDRLIETLVEKYSGSTVNPRILLERHSGPFEEVFGTAALHLIRDTPTISRIVMDPAAATMIVAVDAAILCGLVALESARAGTPVEMPSVNELAGSSLSLEQLSVNSTPAMSSERLPALDMDLGANPIGIVGEDTAPIALSRDDDEGAAPMMPMSEMDSGVVNVDHLAAIGLMQANESGSMPAVRGNDPNAVVLNAFLQIHGKNLYQVLGVEPDATIDQIVVAYEVQTRKFAPDAFMGINLGANATKLENIRGAYNRAFKVLTNRKLRSDYDSDLGKRAPEDDLLGAELLFGEARQLIDDKHPKEALAKLGKAIKAAPEEPAYHAFMGWALFLAGGKDEANAGRERIEHALTLNPDHVDAHEFLGRVAFATGDEETARRELERALELDPKRVDCLVPLSEIFANTSEFHATERVYKRTLRALGDRHLNLRQRLWKELAQLYDGEFDDPASARIAYEMAARLSPEDIELQRKVVQLNAQDLNRWKDIARAIAAEWRVRPFDAELGSALVDLFLRVGKNDAATIAASAMVLRGLATPEYRNIADRSAPRLLTRLSQSIDGAMLQRIRHSGEDVEMEFLFATLSTRGILPAFTDAEVGLFGEQPMRDKDLPEVFARVLEYVCGVLKVKVPPRIFNVDALDGDARLADTRPQALFVGPKLLLSNDTIELGFRLGRAMSFGTPGRLTGASRSGRQLKPYLLACMAFARQALSGGEIEVVPIVEQLESCDDPIRQRLKDLGTRLIRDRSAINLSAWSKSLSRTANRLSLLVSGDLLRVGRAIGEEEGGEAVEDLLEFALSVEHFDLREELGISSVV